MNKFYLLITTFLLLLIGTFVLADGEAKYSKVFSTRLIHCFRYHGTYTLKDGTFISREIFGWKDNHCRYVETTKTEEETKTYSCNLDLGTVKNLSYTMLSDPNGDKASDELWDKYKKDENVCKIND